MIYHHSSINSIFINKHKLIQFDKARISIEFLETRISIESSEGYKSDSEQTGTIRRKITKRNSFKKVNFTFTSAYIGAAAIEWML